MVNSIKPDSQQPALPLVVYEPSRGWLSLRLRELWDYRELLVFLTWRDIKVRYAQAVLGIKWVIIKPLLTMIIFSVIFGNLANLPSGLDLTEVQLDEVCKSVGIVLFCLFGSDL